MKNPIRDWIVLIAMVVCNSFLAIGCGGTTQTAGVGGVDISQLPPRDQIIQYAARGDVASIENILTSDPKAVNARTGPRRRTPLHIAAANGQKKAVQLLLEKGANANIQDEDGYTAADVAAQEGHEDLAQIIQQAAASMPASNANPAAE